MKKTDWIETYTAKAFYPFEPDIELLDIQDIAHALSLICRFTGHCKFFYSVAEHSLNCLQLARDLNLDIELQKWAFMHDTAEAYLTDLSRPVKKSVSGYREAENFLINMIALRYGLKDLDEKEVEIIKTIDDTMLATEQRDLFGFRNEWFLAESPYAGIRIVQETDWKIIKQEFLNQCKILKIQ